MPAELPCAVCRHFRYAHEPAAYEPIGATRCQLCPCAAFVPSAPRPLSAYGRMLVQDSFDMRRPCASCSCPAMNHVRTVEAPPCRNCGREPDFHAPGVPQACRYEAGAPDGGCFMCNSKATPDKCPAYVDPWAVRPEVRRISSDPEPPHEPAAEPAA